MRKATTIPEYIDALPAEQAKVVKKVRTAVRKAVAKPDEKISYGMPSLKLDNGYPIYYGAQKKHLGMYPIKGLPTKLEKKVSPYRSTENTLQFKWGAPVPYDLITEIAEALSK